MSPAGGGDSRLIGEGCRGEVRMSPGDLVVVAMLLASLPFFLLFLATTEEPTPEAEGVPATTVSMLPHTEARHKVVRLGNFFVHRFYIQKKEYISQRQENQARQKTTKTYPGMPPFDATTSTRQTTSV